MKVGLPQQLPLVVLLLLAWHAAALELDAAEKQLQQQQQLKYQQAVELRSGLAAP